MSTSSSKSVRPKDELVLKIIKGVGLCPKDRLGTADPFCVVSIGDTQIMKTNVKRRTLEPRWGTKTSIDLEDYSDDTDVTFTVLHGSVLKKNSNFMGTAVVRLGELLDFGNEPTRIKLSDRSADDDEANDSMDRDDDCGDIVVLVQRSKSEERARVSLDDFDLLAVIGQGTYGKVFQVRKRSSGQIFAMKVIKKHRILTMNEVEHTMTEREVLHDVDSPFVVKMHYAFQSEDSLHFVMDFVPGGELFFHLQQETVFSDERVRFYAAELVLALEHLHKLNIVYRDLKPENVLLDAEGHVALTDFGLSKGGLGYGDTTKTFCGTAEYLAPEMVLGQPYGFAVDWWSLGLLLYEMYCGDTPFFDENPHEMYNKILQDDLEFPDYMSEPAMDLISGLLDRSPSRRLGGSIVDAAEIKLHNYFHGMDWKRVARRKEPPPFVPDVKSLEDTHLFDEEFTSKTPELSLADTTLTSADQEHFVGFSYSGSSLSNASLGNSS